MKLKKETFWFHENLKAASQEVVAVSTDEGQTLMTSHILRKNGQSKRHCSGQSILERPQTERLSREPEPFVESGESRFV